MQKAVLGIVVLFAGFYLMQQPEGLAEVSKSASAAAWDGVTAVFNAVIEFLNALFS